MASFRVARAPADVLASSSVSMSMDSGTPSFFTPSSSAVRPQRSSDSVKTSLAFLKVPSSRAICSTVSTMTRLNSSASSAGTVEKAAVRLTSAIGVDLQDVRVRLGGVGADGEADRLAHFVFARARCPGTCQVALGSVGVAGGEVGRQVAEERGLLVERPLLVLPARDDLLFDGHVASSIYLRPRRPNRIRHRLRDPWASRAPRRGARSSASSTSLP